MLASLAGACLIGANLAGACLVGANLSNADFRGAVLHSACLSGAVGVPAYLEEKLRVVPSEGAFEGFAKAYLGNTSETCLVRLRIPAEARRSNATTRRCRAEFVDVLEIIGAPKGVFACTEGYGLGTKYRVGKRVYADKWDDNRWAEYGDGIYFYLTKEEAEGWAI